MYNVESINEKNLFVVKKNNSVKKVSYRNNTEDATYVPTGTFVHIDNVGNDITDAMLESAKEKGSRKEYIGVVFPQENNDTYPEIAHVRPCQLRKATKEDVTKCIKYAQEYNNVLEEREREKKEENERKYAEYVAEKERKARELDEFRGSLKGKWAEFVSKVMRKLAVELLFLAGKCNKKQIANNERLGYSRFDRRSYLVSDCFKKLYGLTIDEFADKRKEFINSGHSGREWDENFSSRRGYDVELDSMGTLLAALGYTEKIK